MYIAHHFISYGSIPLSLELITSNGGLRSLCHSFRFNYHQLVLKTFPDPHYLCSDNDEMKLFNFLVNLYVYSSSFHLAPAQLL